jgi:hemerythrin-like domain-containing protein
MNIFDDIADEHKFFEKAAGSLVTLAKEFTITNTAEMREDLKSLCDFFINYMVKFHTQKEESVIFTSLEKLGLPREKGPLYYYALEHAEHQKQAGEILAFLEKSQFNDDDKKNLAGIATDFCGKIWEHIDKEDSVFLTEVVERVRGGALLEMNKAYEIFLVEFKFTNTTAEQWLQIAGRIIEKYKPVLTLPDFIRGDGCMSCRHYGAGCNGIEHEWWTEHEWEDFFERNDRD